MMMMMTLLLLLYPKPCPGCRPLFSLNPHLFEHSYPPDFRLTLTTIWPESTIYKVAIKVNWLDSRWSDQVVRCNCFVYVLENLVFRARPTAGDSEADRMRGRVRASNGAGSTEIPASSEDDLSRAGRSLDRLPESGTGSFPFILPKILLHLWLISNQAIFSIFPSRPISLPIIQCHNKTR